MAKECNIQEYKKELDAISSTVLKAYFDSVMFLTIVKLATDKRKTSNFYLTIRIILSGSVLLYQQKV